MSYNLHGADLPENMRETERPLVITLSAERERELEELLTLWDFDTMKFLKGYLTAHLARCKKRPGWRDRFAVKKELKLNLLKKPPVFLDQEERFRETGEKNAAKAFEKIFVEELNFSDTAYLLDRTRKETANEVVPEELVDLLRKSFWVHLKKEKISVPGVPLKPFFLFVGPTGSGKTHTVKAAIEQAIFDNRLIIERDPDEERAEIVKKYAYLKIPLAGLIAPPKELIELDKRIERDKTRMKLLKRLGKKYWRKYASRKLKEMEDSCPGRSDDCFTRESYVVSYRSIVPSDVATALHGETGNLFRRAMRPEDKPTIRHLEEAHAILVKNDKRHDGAADPQNRSLSTAVNVVLDEISDGKRECLLIADTHSPGDIAPDIFRRFDEMGRVIDVSEYWKNTECLEKLIALEARQHKVRPEDEALKQITKRVASIFSNKGITITPSYVRKLIASVIEAKDDLKIGYFHDELLVRDSFKNVARNSHGDFFGKIVRSPKTEDGFSWEDYQGERVKLDFAEKLLSTAFYGGDSKGVVLTGPAGSGKTFLTQVVAAANPQISCLIVKMDDLYKAGQGYEGIISALDDTYNIARMLAPSLVVINEGDALAKRRNTQASDPSDKITNKFLDILDGEQSIKGVFTVLTTNLLENMDPAIVRPGRLEIMNIDGKLKEGEIYNIIRKKLAKEPRSAEVTDREIYVTAKSISNIPAGYADFAEKLMDSRRLEFEIIQAYRKTFNDEPAKINDFILYNAKSVMRILEAIDFDPKVISRAKKDIQALFEHKEDIYRLLEKIGDSKDYELKLSHLVNAKADIMKNPLKQGFKALDEFLKDELSDTPQVGKICGAAYGNNTGLLVPINTNLVPRSGESGNVFVTGAIKGPITQEDHSEMTLQSADEALTLNAHYFQNILASDPRCRHIDAAAIMGKILKNRRIHHQIVTVNYQGGGPSAGFALAINTLSVLLNIRVYHDFGITGAPGTRGKSGDKAGSSVMIGGEDKKTERVLIDLDRMYVPAKNFTIPLEQQEAYWEEGKIVLPVYDYSDLIPEVLHLDATRTLVKDLIAKRIDLNKKSIFESEEKLAGARTEISGIEKTLKTGVEFEIRRRLVSYYNFFVSPECDEYASIGHILEKHDSLR
ncbi:MAG: AAA family ATPase [Candidatus Falkowbacteria bacterium]